MLRASPSMAAASCRDTRSVAPFSAVAMMLSNHGTAAGDAPPIGLPARTAAAHRSTSAVVSSRGVLCMRFAVHRVHLWHFGERVKFDGLKTGAPFPTSVVVFSSIAAPRPHCIVGTAARPWFGEVWL